ncbi:MAG TPA: hypothetical protein EYQ22_00510 [Gammaproteobacteria bacterium]|nr:hypothetical protein [Gammaproteobacteria bacterium]HIK71224.1 hypothetical protein [Pseudomonadales bacterium]|tara:strand:+ start:371 stop:817 length:447 start_codon:yes stop_codon:yes gene_type:complete
MTNSEDRDENLINNTGKKQPSQILLLKDVVDLLVQHSGGTQTTATTGKLKGRQLKNATQKQPIPKMSSEDPDYDPDTLDLFSDVYNTIQIDQQDGEAIENTINQLVDQYARSVVCKLNEDLIGQLEDLSALLSDSDTSEFSAKDDDKY